MQDNTLVVNLLLLPTCKAQRGKGKYHGNLAAKNGGFTVNIRNSLEYEDGSLLEIGPRQKIEAIPDENKCIKDAKLPRKLQNGP